MMEDNLLEFPFRKSHFRHPSVDVDCKCTTFTIFSGYFLLNISIQLVFLCCCDLQILQVQQMIPFHDVDNLDHVSCAPFSNFTS